MKQHTYTEHMGQGGINKIIQRHVTGKRRRVMPNQPDYLEAKAEEGQPRIKVAPYVEKVEKVIPLDEQKEKRIEAVDRKTEEIILGSFIHGGKRFSSSEHAQSNFLATEIERLAGRATYPMPWSTIDGGFEMFNDDAGWIALYSACVTHVRGKKIEGLTLRAEIQEAADEDALEAIADDRS